MATDWNKTSQFVNAHDLFYKNIELYFVVCKTEWLVSVVVVVVSSEHFALGWWAGRDLDSRPFGYQPNALTMLSYRPSAILEYGLFIKRFSTTNRIYICNH